MHEIIRAELRAEYEELVGRGGYRSLGVAWGVSTGVAWNLVNDDSYWPKDKKIRLALEVAARARGIPVRRRGRKRDLWSMDPAVLLWRLLNRADCKVSW